MSASKPESKLWGLVLVGRVTDGFYDGLQLIAQSSDFSNFVVHDVSGGIEQTNVLAALSGATLSYGQLPWFGEVANRQLLADLLPQNRVGVLFDSTTVVRKTNKVNQLSNEIDCFSSVFYESGLISRRTNVFRGGIGARVRSDDFTQVENIDGIYAGSFDLLEFERL